MKVEEVIILGTCFKKAEVRRGFRRGLKRKKIFINYGQFSVQSKAIFNF